MTKPLTIALALSVLASATGCSFHARSPEDYKNDTRAVLETRSTQIQSCYDAALSTDPNAAGNVVVSFTVMEKTGEITDPQVLPESSAPAPLGQCIVEAINGLALQPPDERKGDATFVWEFRKG